MAKRDFTNFTKDDLRGAMAYIDQHWQALERFRPHDNGTLVGVPKPYIIPSEGNDSGFSFEEMYYWDSYFVAQAFIGTPKEHLALGMLDNLLALQKRFNIIPNCNRFYSSGRSQPPFLSSLIMDLYPSKRSKRWLARVIDVAKQEYRTVWTGASHPNWRKVFHGLSRNYDINVLDELAETESGWDMTTRFGGKCLSYIPIDLNALLYKYETDFEAAARILGDEEEAKGWALKARTRKNTVNRHLWNDQKGFYFDYNFETGELGKIWSLAAYFPLWAGMVSQAKAARLVQNLIKFESAGGLTTTAARPIVYDTIPTQWAHPNGWAPLHWIVIGGLRRYGFDTEADRITKKWLGSNLLHFQRQGVFLEKYNVVNPSSPPRAGVYPSQVGFGWSNAVFYRLAEGLLAPEVETQRAGGRQWLRPAFQGIVHRP